MEIDDLICRVRKRASRQALPPPASPRELAESEERIGFDLPPLLRSIYSEIANGGFGPGYGFIGLITRVPLGQFKGDSAVELFESFRDGDLENPTWVWPERLIPSCDWGCAIRSCIDCSEPRLPIIRFDPNKPEDQFVRESPSLAEWLEDWLDGKDLW
jgi:hypothetical protein